MTPEDPIAVTLELQRWNLMMMLMGEGYKALMRDLQYQCNSAVMAAQQAEKAAMPMPAEAKPAETKTE